MGTDTFPEGISLKVKLIARLEFELAYFDAAVQHFRLYARETQPLIAAMLKKMFRSWKLALSNMLLNSLLRFTLKLTGGITPF